MYPNIYHIYGPLYINCYGIAIALSIIIFSWLIKKNDNFKKLITFEQFNNTLFLSIIIGIIGGRLLWAIEDWHLIKSFWHIFAFWEPGYAILGTVLSILIFIPLYLKSINITILPLLDIVAIYAPLMHSISRIGCFFAGCCHGIPTKSIFGIIYTHPEVAVPKHLKFIKIHPTQLYTTFFLFILFIMMYFIFQNRLKKNGQLLSVYLIFTSLERFLNDFLRSDREFYNSKFFKIFSTQQWLSLIICSTGIILFLYFTFLKNNLNKFFLKNYSKKKNF